MIKGTYRSVLVTAMQKVPGAPTSILKLVGTVLLNLIGSNIYLLGKCTVPDFEILTDRCHFIFAAIFRRHFEAILLRWTTVLIINPKC